MTKTRTIKFTATSALAVLVLIGSPPATRAGDDIELPVRKAGQWEMKTIMDEGNGPKEQLLTMCVDAEMEKNASAVSRTEHKESCKKYEVSELGDKIVVEAQCTFNGRDVVSRTEMSGDFAKTFQVKIDSTTSGSNGSQTVTVKRTITQTGTYQGESCGDLKAGEARGSDGKKVLMQ
jgi:hypothetical protein